MSDANISELENVGTLELNFTMFNDTTTLPMEMFTIVKDSVGDAWFYASIFGIFLFLNWLFYRQEENFGFDIGRSLLISSSFAFIISTALLLSDWVNTIYPVIWFGSLMFIGFIMVYSLKQKNQ